MSAIVFGRVPPPAHYQDDYIDKPAGWLDLGPRVIRGVCLHRTLGGPIATTGDYFRTFDAHFDDGGHGWNSLTDWGIGLDGAVLRWNADARRAPNANGPADDLEGDGPAFVRRYGVAAVNRDLESIELEGRTYETPTTEAQLTAAAELIAWRIDLKARIPWNIWPQNLDDLPALYWHNEFGPKRCPGSVIEDRTDDLIDRVQARLKRFQTGVDPQPSPPIIDGLDERQAAAWFGSAVAAGRLYRFDPQGPVSRLWLQAGRETGQWPALTRVELAGDRRYFRFANGLTIWTAPGQDARILRE